MSSEYITSLFNARSLFSTYVAIPICILGITSELFSVIVFLSLKTFRQNSCAFYLMSMSSFNFIRLLFGVSFNVMSMAFPINWTSVLFYFCRLRTSLIGFSYLSAIICLCLAVIDQYFATCSRPYWQKWSNIKVAHRVTIIITIICMLHAISFLIFFNQLSSSNTATCISSNPTFLQYYVYGYFFTFGTVLPLIAVIFGIMSFRNARTLTTRTNPLIRRELDKQLTVMVLVEICVYVCTYIPFLISNAFSSLNTSYDPVFLAQLNLINAFTFTLFIVTHGNSFFTYVCVSKRFRRQAKYVLYDIYINRCRQNRIVPNHVEIQIVIDSGR
ncbi:hypothetical protein I4U23_023079 [Adineta vaga]|nr:hypothetical protein I4U23_023079 [Adineta vaga]